MNANRPSPEAPAQGDNRDLDGLDHARVIVEKNDARAAFPKSCNRDFCLCDNRYVSDRRISNHGRFDRPRDVQDNNKAGRHLERHTGRPRCECLIRQSSRLQDEKNKQYARPHHPNPPRNAACSSRLPATAGNGATEHRRLMKLNRKQDQ
jgi:hypothetical protein